MFKSYKQLLLSVCFERSTPRNSLCSMCKSTLAVQDNKKKCISPVSNLCDDPIDVFTNTIILENLSKWRTNNLSTTKKLTSMKSNSIFKSCDDPDHLMTYLQQCLDGYCVVKKSVLTQFMLTMAKHGRINGLVLIEKLNAKYDYCIKKSDLQMNFAEAYWANGNLDCMFKIFETFYPNEAMKVNHVLEPIIYTIIKSRGVASVIMVSKFANSVINKHGDFHPMGFLWKYLFLSELYNDNLEAEKLLLRNGTLAEHIEYIVPSITNNVLKKHRTDCVQRLMTILLKHNQMKSYQWVLRSLFEYYYTLGNVRQCKEIMKHSVEINVSLTQAQQSQLINMVLKNKHPQHINKEVTATLFKLMF